MDDHVLRAMRKWPKVPAVYGWLRLARRGQWFLVDRARLDFDEARDGGGSPITSPPIVDFISRNYLCDEYGAWFWQNGPQRVFVDLELAPLILRVLNESTRQRIATHAGELIGRIDAVNADADGNLFLQTDLGTGLIDDRDIGQLMIEPADDADANGNDAGEADSDGEIGGSGGADALMLALPDPVASTTTIRRWRIEHLAHSGAAALGKHFGFEPKPRSN